MEPVVLGIITARGGSKGIPRKNIRMVAGKPLIAWTIETALASSKLDRVVVSTDDIEIATICRKWKVEVPFLRPSKLAQDNSPPIEAINHAVKWIIDNENWYFDYLMLLQPTSPLRAAEDIDNAISMAVDKNADSIISVTDASPHPYLARSITNKGVLVDFAENTKGDLPRQSLPKVFYENGAIYLLRKDIILQHKNWYTNSTFPYIMPQDRSLDIDTLWDLRLADMIIQDKEKENNNEIL